MSHAVTKFIIEIDDFEEEQGHKNSKESTTVRCKELGYDKTVEYHYGDFRTKNIETKKCLDELVAKIKSPYLDEGSAGS